MTCCRLKMHLPALPTRVNFHFHQTDDSETDLYRISGNSLSLRELTRRMIVNSSNLATNLLIEKVGAERVTRFMQELGTNDLIIRRGPEDNKAYALGMNNSATARSLMQVLVRLAKRSVVSPAASDEMIAILRQQHYNEGIPANCPKVSAWRIKPAGMTSSTTMRPSCTRRSIHPISL